MSEETQPIESATSEVSSASAQIQYDENGNQIKPKVFAKRIPYVLEVTHIGEAMVGVRFADGTEHQFPCAEFAEKFELIPN